MPILPRRAASSVLCALAILGLGSPAAVSSQQQAQVQSCDVHAYVVDPDPAGLNVRAAPGTSSRVLARIPSLTYVRVTGVSGRWMRIDDVEGFEHEVAFRGTGWVFAPMLGTATSDQKWVPLLREARHGSAVVTRLNVGTSLTLEGCRGKWARVRAGQHVGWLPAESRCPLHHTTCA